MAVPTIPGYTNIKDPNGIIWGQPTGLGPNAPWTMLWDANDLAGSALTTNPRSNLGGNSRVATDLSVAGVPPNQIAAIEQVYNNLLAAQGTYQNTIAGVITPTTFGTWVVAHGISGATTLFNSTAGSVVEGLKANTDAGGNIIDPTKKLPSINNTNNLLPSGDNIFDITGATPPPEYEYYYKKPEAAWQAQLTKGGLPTTGNYGNFLTGLQQNTYLNNLLTNLGSIAQGGQMSPYGTTAPEYNANPAAWKALINAPSGSIPSDYLANPSQTGGAVYNMGLNTSKSQGLPLELLMFLAGQSGDLLNRYQAQGMNPSQNYGQYLNQYLGIR